MPLKLKKNILGIILILLSMSIISFIFFKEQLGRMHYSIWYNEEINLVKDYITLLSEGDEAEIRKVSSKDAYFLKTPFYLNGWKKLLRKTDIDSLRPLSVENKSENGSDILFITVYFENKPSLNIGLKLKKMD